MKLEVINIQGEATGKQLDLPANVFGVEPNEHAVYLAVKQYLANQRQGTAKTKERNEVSGSSKKIKKQKGTGTARAGDNKSPLMSRGGRAHGARPREYNSRLNKKVKNLAKRSALTSKVQKEQVCIVENFTLETPETATYRSILAKVNPNGHKTLLVTADYDKNVYLSARNLHNARVMAAKDLSTYDIMNCGLLIISEGAIDKIKEVCS